MLDVLISNYVNTLRAALVSTSVCQDRGSLHAAQALSTQRIAARPGLIKYFQLVSGDSKQLCFTVCVPAILHLPPVIYSEICKTACILAAKSLASVAMHTTCAAVVWHAKTTVIEYCVV